MSFAANILFISNISFVRGHEQRPRVLFTSKNN